MRDTTRQIGRSKLSRPIYDELKQVINLAFLNHHLTKIKSIYKILKKAYHNVSLNV